MGGGTVKFSTLRLRFGCSFEVSSTDRVESAAVLRPEEMTDE